MFAGPNGPGKSTINSLISPELLGGYVNADELEKEKHAHHTIDLSSFGVHSAHDEITSFFRSVVAPQARRPRRRRHDPSARRIPGFWRAAANSYSHRVAANFIPRNLVESSASLTFETVMSSPDRSSSLLMLRREGTARTCTTSRRATLPSTCPACGIACGWAVILCRRRRSGPGRATTSSCGSDT